jgi:hypothetical protein
MSANENTALLDARAVFEAESAYARLNGGRFGSLECLAAPRSCLPHLTEQPPLLKPEQASTAPRDGFGHRFVLSPGADEFEYWATPEKPGWTGRRAFCADADAYAFKESPPAPGGPWTCDSLRVAFEGFREDAARRRKERETLRQQPGR